MSLIDINNKYKIIKKGKKNNCIYINNEGGDKYSEKKYHLIYEKYFKPWQNKKINFLEIGILEGYSLAVHSDYFTKSKLFGYDIDITPFNENLEYLKSIGCFKNNNIQEIKQLSSIDKNIKIDYMFDIILEDGDHNPCAQVKTFENFFPYLNIDGLYIIEDVTDFRLNCLKIYLDFLSIIYNFEKFHDTHGCIIIKYQKINFERKMEAYNKMGEYKQLIKHKKWWEKQYSKLH